MNSNGVLYGGGQGYSTVKNTKVIIEGNSVIPYVTTAGSNGRTDNGQLTVNGGTIKVLQSTNNGSIGVSDVTVNGGKIENLYVGGESGAGGVPGIVETAKVKVLGGIVENLLPGNNNNKEITNATTGITTDVTYATGTVNNVIGNLPVAAKELVKNDININNSEHGTVTVPNDKDIVEGTEVEITVTPDKGYKLSDLKVIDAKGNKIEVKDGKFIMPDSDVTITAEFVKQSEAITDVKNPETSDNIILYLALGALGILGAGATGIYFKKRFN